MLVRDSEVTTRDDRNDKLEVIFGDWVRDRRMVMEVRNDGKSGTLSRIIRDVGQS